MQRRVSVLSAILAAGLIAAVPAAAQFVTLPPSGGHERAEVVQHIGLVRVSIEYSGPHVHTAAGVDRKGQIWGKLVPYGMADLHFGSCGDQCPWRGGANENTVFTTSHDIKVQGQPLPAGRYGLHFIPGPDEWTIIFSKNSTAWGSFSYDAREDALRVKAKPETADYHEVLTYDFPERKLDTATAVLEWENLKLPFVITVDDMPGLYVESLRRELQGPAGFSWEGRRAAALYCLTNKTHLDQGLRWAEQSVDPTVGGQANFGNMTLLAQLQEANGKTAEAHATLEKAIADPTAGAVEVHVYGRQLLAEHKPQEALKIFELNARRHPDQWPVHLGLGRGYAALGRTQEAVAELQLARPQAPDEANRKNIDGLIEQVKAGKPID